MRRSHATTACLLVTLGLTGCSGSSAPSFSPSPSASPSAAPASPTARPSASEPTPSPSSVVLRSVTTHDFAVPEGADAFVTPHTVVPPVAPPPEPPLPCLREIDAAAHPTERPGYDQMSFRFTGAFPGYEVAYVPAVMAPGTGAPMPIPMPGAAAALRVRFFHAQAHDASGRSCVLSARGAAIGGRAIMGYVQAGDFEGVVDYGLAIRVKPSTGGAGRVRTVEVERSDAGRHLFILAVQVTTG